MYYGLETGEPMTMEQIATVFRGHTGTRSAAQRPRIGGGSRRRSSEGAATRLGRVTLR